MFQIENHTAYIRFDEYANQYRDVDKFIAYCKQCDKYNRCWACPPYDFDPEKYMSGFEKVYIIGTKIIPSQAVRLACDTPDKVRETGRKLLAQVREIIDPPLLETEKRYPGSKAFYAGTCFQCSTETCTRLQGKPCVHPQQVRPSLEAFGFDIGKTAEQILHIELKWSKDGKLPEYFTLVSGIFTNYQIEHIL